MRPLVWIGYHQTVKIGRLCNYLVPLICARQSDWPAHLVRFRIYGYELSTPVRSGSTLHPRRRPGTRCAFSKSLAARGNLAAICSESMSFAAPSKTLSEFEPRRPSVPDFRFLEVVRCSGSILAHRVYIFAGKRGLKILQLRKVLMT